MDELKGLRKEIDKIDQALLELLAERLRVVKKIGKVKGKLGIHIKDSKREQELLDRLSKKAKKLEIGEEVISAIWKNLFKTAYKIEK